LCEALLAPERFAGGATVCRACAGTREPLPRGGERPHTGRTRELHEHVEANARHMRAQGHSPAAIAAALGIEQSSEWNRLVEICSERQYRRYQRGPAGGGPVHRKSGKYFAA
jgi:hypothetical protein